LVPVTWRRRRRRRRSRRRHGRRFISMLKLEGETESWRLGEIDRSRERLGDFQSFHK
jgi:hypothetical protein